MLQLGNLLLLGDHRFAFRRFRAGDRELGGDLQTLRALDRQRLSQSRNVIRNSAAILIQRRSESQNWTRWNHPKLPASVVSSLCPRSAAASLVADSYNHALEHVSHLRRRD